MQSRGLARFATATVVVIFAMAMAAYAADQPKLTIESPQNGATVSPTPGLGEVVMIKFKTDNFKIMSLDKGMGNMHNASNASAGSMGSSSGTMSEQPPMSASSGAAGPYGASGPNATTPGAAAGTETGTAATGNMPQSDVSGTATTNASHASPNSGHMHVTLDNNRWFWVHSDKDPIVLVGLTPGQHSVKLDLVSSDHTPTGVSQTVNFTVPAASSSTR